MRKLAFVLIPLLILSFVIGGMACTDDDDVYVPPRRESNVQISHISYYGVMHGEFDEFVQITNFGDLPQDLTGWVLTDVSDGHPSYTFPPYLLGPGGNIRVYTNQVHIPWGRFSFQYDEAVWDNSDPDVAALYDAQGQEVSRRSYLPSFPES
jgi:hypothetical protein